MITLNTRPCHYASLFVPWSGRWIIDVKLEGEAPASLSKVTVSWNDAVYVGTVDPLDSGSFQNEAHVRIIGGYGWQNILKTEAGWLHDDSGLSCERIAGALARVVGETIEAPSTAFRQGRVSHGRASVAAARALRELLGAGQWWWVEPDGVTKAGVRPSTTLSNVDMLAWDPSRRAARFNVASPAELPLGGVIPASTDRGHPSLRIFELNALSMAGEERYTVSVEVI